MIIMGTPSVHSPTWTLLVDGKIISSIEEDRLHRIKNRFGLVNSLGEANVFDGWQYCLDAGGITAQDIDQLAFGYNPSSIHTPQMFDVRWELFHQERAFTQQAILLDTLRRRYKVKAEAIFVRHHLAHAASVFFTSPFEEAVIVTADGWGEDETVTVSVGRGNSITRLASVIVPNSLGIVYTKITTSLGWGMDDAGKTMGLSSFGDIAPVSPRLISHGKPEESTLWFDTSEALKFVGNLPPRAASAQIEQIHRNAAATIQHEIEETLIYIAKWAHNRTACPFLCISGGVALNSLANTRILTECDFAKVFIQPACGDNGLPLGAALQANFVSTPEAERIQIRQPYFGKEYSESSIRQSLIQRNFEIIEDQETLAKTVAGLIAAGKVVAWFQGGSEFGPRALGHRSILADPRNPDMKDWLNNHVKHREGFRPFAASVLEERVNEYFDFNSASPFMLFVATAKASKRHLIPAVLHVDDSSRLQTVSRQDSAIFYRLIEEFGALTNIPMVLNTSFNIAGEPLVETPEDAVRTFARTEIDYLVIGHFLVRKEDDALRNAKGRALTNSYF